MGSGPALRRVAVAAAVSIVTVGAFAAARELVRLASEPRERPSGGAVVRASTAAANRGTARRGDHRRRRVHAEAAAGSGATETVVVDERLDAAKPSAELLSDPPSKSADPHLVAELFEEEVVFPRRDFALRAVLDVETATGMAPVVVPGSPPAVALADFVATEGGVVDRAAELVGERKPALDPGEPVALTGRVVDRDDGTPLVGAHVLVTSTFYVRSYFYDHHLREVASVTTDADGVYRIERVNADPAHFGRGGRMYVAVTADGHAPSLAVPLADVSPGVANRLPDVSLARATQTLRGRVVDQWEGRPVAGGRVFATGAIDPISYPKDERAALFVGAPTATTDADGRFVLEGLGTGVETISVHGGDDCVGVEAVALPHDGEFRMRTRAIRGRIEGTTLDEHGAPVALVVVEGGDNSTHSFADGHFVLENFRGDSVTIRFTHPDFAPVAREGVRDGAAGLVVHMERPRPTVVLDVRDRDTSAPVARIDVGLTFVDDRARPAPTSPARLAADGRYAVRVPEGATSAAVAAEGFTAETVTLTGRTDGEIVRVLLAPVR